MTSTSFRLGLLVAAFLASSSFALANGSSGAVPNIKQIQSQTLTTAVPKSSSASAPKSSSAASGKQQK